MNIVLTLLIIPQVSSFACNLALENGTSKELLERNIEEKSLNHTNIPTNNPIEAVSNIIPNQNTNKNDNNNDQFNRNTMETENGSFNNTITKSFETDLEDSDGISGKSFNNVTYSDSDITRIVNNKTNENHEEKSNTTTERTENSWSYDRNDYSFNDTISVNRTSPNESEPNNAKRSFNNKTYLDTKENNGTDSNKTKIILKFNIRQLRTDLFDHLLNYFINIVKEESLSEDSTNKDSFEIERKLRNYYTPYLNQYLANLRSKTDIKENIKTKPNANIEKAPNGNEYNSADDFDKEINNQTYDKGINGNTDSNIGKKDSSETSDTYNREIIQKNVVTSGIPFFGSKKKNNKTELAQNTTETIDINIKGKINSSESNFDIDAIYILHKDDVEIKDLHKNVNNNNKEINNSSESNQDTDFTNTSHTDIVKMKDLLNNANNYTEINKNGIDISNFDRNSDNEDLTTIHTFNKNHINDESINTPNFETKEDEVKQYDLKDSKKLNDSSITTSYESFISKNDNSFSQPDEVKSNEKIANMDDSINIYEKGFDIHNDNHKTTERSLEENLTKEVMNTKIFDKTISERIISNLKTTKSSLLNTENIGKYDNTTENTQTSTNLNKELDSNEKTNATEITEETVELQTNCGNKTYLDIEIKVTEATQNETINNKDRTEFESFQISNETDGRKVNATKKSRKKVLFKFILHVI